MNRLKEIWNNPEEREYLGGMMFLAGIGGVVGFFCFMLISIAGWAGVYFVTIIALMIAGGIIMSSAKSKKDEQRGSSGLPE